MERIKSFNIDKRNKCIKAELTSGCLVKIEIDDILFFECMDRKIIMNTSENQDDYLINHTCLDDLQMQFGDLGFIRTHRSYLVHFLKVIKIDKLGDRTYELTYRNSNKTAFTSRTYEKDIRKKFLTVDAADMKQQYD